MEKEKTLSEEHKRRISNSLKGRTPWNKGKQGCVNPGGWNKGLTKKDHSGIRSQAKKMIGKNNPSWRGGVLKRTETLQWKQLAKKIRDRDNHICQYCNIKNVILDVHHKVPYNISQDDSPENLITLCRSCHTKEDRRLDKIYYDRRNIDGTFKKYIFMKAMEKD